MLVADVQTVHVCILQSISHSSSEDVFGGVKIPSSSNISQEPGNTARISSVEIPVFLYIRLASLSFFEIPGLNIACLGQKLRIMSGTQLS